MGESVDRTSRLSRTLLLLSFLAFRCMLCCSVSLFAAGAPSRDASQLLEHLREKGVPDLSDAEFVALGPNAYGVYRQDELHWLRTAYKGDNGYAGDREVFVLANGADGDPLFFDPNTLTSFRLRLGANEARRGADAAQDGGADEPAERLLPGCLRLACLKAHDALFIGWLLKERGEQTAVYDGSFERATNALLLASMAAQKAPLRSYARRLARFALACTDAPPDVLESACLSRIADGQYLSLAVELKQTHDWEAFIEGLEELLETHGQTWLAAAPVRRLLVELRSRAAPPPLPPDGEFTAEQRRRAADFLATGDFGPSVRMHRAPWLLFPPDYLQHRPPADALVQLLALRSQAVPILRAWEKDDTLTVFFDTGGWQWPDDAGRKIRARQRMIAQRLPRPQPRSLIAEDLLDDLLPNNANYAQNEERRNERLAQLQRMSPRELAWSEVRKHRSRKAVYFLAKNGGPDDIRRLQDGFLSTEPDAVSGWNGLLRPYVAARGPEATHFLDRLQTRFRTNRKALELIKSARRLAEARAEAREQEEPQAPPPLKTAIADYLASEPWPQTTEPTLVLQDAVLRLESLDARLAALKSLVQAATQADADLKSSGLLSQVSVLPFSRYFRDLRRTRATWSGFALSWDELLQGQAPRRPANTLFHSQSFIPVDSDWDFRRALAFVRELGGAWLSWLEPIGDPGAPQARTNAMKNQAVKTIVSLTHHPHTVALMQRAHDHVGDRWNDEDVDAWGAEEVVRLLNGEIDRLPLLPTPDSVAPARRKAMLRAVASMKAENLSAYLKGLRLDERVALFDACHDDADSGCAAILRKNALTIQEARSEIDSDGLREACERVKGRLASLRMVRAVGTMLQAEAEELGQVIVARFDFRQTGTVLSFEPLDDHWTAGQREYTGIMMELRVGGTHPLGMLCLAYWLDAPPPPGAKGRSSILRSSTARYRQRVWRRLERFLSPSFRPELLPVPRSRLTLVARPRPRP